MPRELALAAPAAIAPTPLLGAAAAAPIPLLNVALWKVAAITAVLAPLAIGARLAGATRRVWLEVALASGALAELGIHDRPLAIERLGGGRSNAVYKLRFASRTLVLKQGLAEGTLLALAARWVGPQPFARDVTAAARIGREARALAALHAAGVRVPRVVVANPRAGLLLVELVEGEPLPATLDRPGAAARIRAYAAAIRAAHRAGVTLGDGHPGNALVAADGTLTLIDLEFAECETTCSHDFAARCAFDIAYASQYFTDDERATFLAAAIGDPETAVAVRDATARLADFGLLFALEQRRQRASNTSVAADEPHSWGQHTSVAVPEPSPWRPSIRDTGRTHERRLYASIRTGERTSLDVYTSRTGDIACALDVTAAHTTDATFTVDTHAADTHAVDKHADTHAVIDHVIDDATVHDDLARANDVVYRDARRAA